MAVAVTQAKVLLTYIPLHGVIGPCDANHIVDLAHIDST